MAVRFRTTLVRKRTVRNSYTCTEAGLAGFYRNLWLARSWHLSGKTINMFKLNLKVALRNLWKNKGYTAINILGLSIGMSSCILIFIFIHFQLSFDKEQSKGDRIYRFVSDWTYNSSEDHTQGVPIPLAAAARDEFAGLDKVGRISRDAGIITIKDEIGKPVLKEEEQTYYVETDFFDIFDFNWIAGKARPGLNEPNTVALSSSLAIKYFGTVDKALGKTILYNNELNLRVVGVFADQPENSSFPLNVVISYPTYSRKHETDWDSVGSNNECYFLLKEGFSIADLQKPLKDFNTKYFKDKNLSGNQTTGIQSLSDIHFSELYGNFADSSITRTQIYGLAVIGIFLMVTACINFINLATAQAINRSKEVGVRKVMGSGRKQLVVQFLTETFAINLIALLIGCVMAEIALPTMQNLFSVKISFSLFASPVIFVFMTAMLFIVSFLAGFYPAMIMSGFSPALAIKNKVIVNSGSLSMRKILVVVQFSITVILLISTLFIIKQMAYVREKPLGFDSKAIVMLSAPTDSISKTRRAGLMQRIMQIPGVQGLSYCVRPPLSGDMNTTNFSLNGKENKDFEVRLTPADENYFSTFGLKFLAGRAYQKSSIITGYVVNETFLKKVGISDPETAMGKLITQNKKTAPIVGVVEDFNDQSLKEKISPMLIFSEERRYYKSAIKMDSKRTIPIMKEVAQIWNSTYPNEIYKARFVEESINKYYSNEQLMGTLLKGFAGVIIFISVIGLFGLISFVAAQRTKEMAIRKVLGATTVELVKMLNGSFLKMVLIANLVAWPVAYLLVSRWLEGFAYRTDIGVWPFVAAMVISMFITLITVSFRSYRAAVTNAIDALKYE